MGLKESTRITITDLPSGPLMHKMVKSHSFLTKKTIATIVLIIAGGILSGFLLSSATRRQATIAPTTSSQTGASKVVGSPDSKTFRDTAEGVLEVGSINGEGTHRLVRSGGESQTVYLTSSVLDLNQFIGKKVRVWGETFAAKKAGWLMDVGKIEIL